MRRVLLAVGVSLAALVLIGGGARAYVASRFSDGVLSLKAGNYEAAREQLLLLARCGHSDSQHLLGQIYAFGWGVPRSDDVAIHWFRRAKKWAEPGVSPEAPAEYYVAEGFETGFGVDADLEVALQWYRRAADGGHSGAKKKLQELSSKADPG